MDKVTALQLYSLIIGISEQAKTGLAVSVNAELGMFYWKVGNTFSKYLPKDQQTAYGKKTVSFISQIFGKNWSEKHLRHCLRVAETFPEDSIVSALRRQLNSMCIKAIVSERLQLKG